MVGIAAGLLEEILARAGATAEVEVCGLLFGTPERIEAVRHTANSAAEPQDSFEVDPAALLAALRAERGGGARLVGHYHSHPNGLAVPSARDLAAAEPGRLWLIIGGGEARLWLAEKRGFRALPLEQPERYSCSSSRLPWPSQAATSAASPPETRTP